VKLILALTVSAVVLVGVAWAGIDDKHPAHERAEDFVCEHPRHAYRAHGLKILPEACE
jgi:hypothetical protein